MNKDSKIYSMANLLITGGSGMVGKKLLEHPSAQNYQVSK